MAYGAEFGPDLIPDAGDDFVPIAENLGGRDAHDVDSLRSEPGGPADVVLGMACGFMDEAVHLHRQASLCAIEIQDVGADRMLAPKGGPARLA